MSNETRHIFVLVAGTVDPICLNPNEVTRAASYESNNNYWANNQAFIQGLKDLCEQYPHLALFDAHGWSGDNTKENREIAGAYLANRLCGSMGQQAYYAGYKSKPVAFHLIGHSHGGNVLNEFTKRAAQAAEWPDDWQIKSITYLSTPFFNHQHQLDCSVLHEDCRIINVTNDFDLTQRVIADFSMYDLVSAYKLASDHTPAMQQALQEIKQTAFVAGINKLIEVFAKPSVLKLLFNSADYKLEKDDGDIIYPATIAFLENVKRLLTEFRQIVEKLSSAIYYPSDDTVSQLMPQNNRRFVSEQLKDKINELTDALLKDISCICDALTKRNEKHDYRLTPLLGDIAPELNRIIDFFAIDINHASGPFIDIFYALLNNQIENFDNTGISPRHQLPDHFSAQLFHVDVTDKDGYYNYGDLDGFHLLVKQLEQAEQDYEHNPTQKNLLRICVTLLAPQSELARFKSGLSLTIKKLDEIFGTTSYSLRRFAAHLLTLRGDMTPIRKLAIRLQTLLKSYELLIKEFDVPLLRPIDRELRPIDKELRPIDEDTTPSQNDVSGTLAHFAVVSHSISRQTLHPEVIEILRPQFEHSKAVEHEKS